MRYWHTWNSKLSTLSTFKSNLFLLFHSGICSPKACIKKAVIEVPYAVFIFTINSKLLYSITESHWIVVIFSPFYGDNLLSLFIWAGDFQMKWEWMLQEADVYGLRLIKVCPLLEVWADATGRKVIAEAVLSTLSTVSLIIFLFIPFNTFNVFNTHRLILHP